MSRILSPQQATAIAAAVSGDRHQIIPSVAGSGKTTVLLEIPRLIPTSKTIAFCAFNRDITTEIKERIAQEFRSRNAQYNNESEFDSPIEKYIPKNVKVGTLHSFGFGAIRRSISRVKFDGNKLRNLARNEFTGEYENLQQFVISAVAMAKEIGIGAIVEDNIKNWSDMLDHHNLWDSLPDKVTPEQGIDAAQYLLRCNNSLKNIIDYSDMIYFPVLFGMKIWQHDYILLDEAQDTNGPRRALVKMMLKPNGKLIAVGDPHQAIYGFTGADNRSLDIIREEFKAIVTPLSVTFRCPKVVVRRAQQWVSHIEAHESAPEGVEDFCEIRDIAKLAKQEDVIICRNTKPLVELAYSLIRQSIPCKVEGRKIGEGLVKIAQRWKRIKTVGELPEKLEVWKETEMQKYKAKGEDGKCQAVEDQAETLGIFISECDSSDPISVLVERIRSLFSDTEGEQKVLTLSTIHKAKGKEWDRVFALGMDTYSPSKWARKEWEMEQEDNLCYVQVTRSKHHLTLVNVPVKKS
jgi:DNA helicase-2/ATP-dependent DNA helicase PcrA